MSCTHTHIIIKPGTIIPEGDGFIIGDIEKGTMFCQSCNDELPIEDLQFYSEQNIAIAIPTDLVDTPSVSEPLQ